MKGSSSRTMKTFSAEESFVHLDYTEESYFVCQELLSQLFKRQ